MAKPAKCLLLAALLAGIGAAGAQAEIRIVDSLEWMAMDAPLIVRGRVTESKDTKGPGDVTYRDVTVAVDEAIKGKLEEKTVVVRLRLFPEDKAGLAWKESGHAYLFFLRKGRAADDKALADCWVLRDERQPTVDLDKPKRAYFADMTKGRKADDILKAVREYAKKESKFPEVGEPNYFKPQAGYLRLEVSGASEIHGELFGGSTCYLNVPADEKYRPLAMKKAQSENAWERAGGADMLRNYPGKETIELLTKLLQDPGEAKWVSNSAGLERVSYPARAAAYDALRALGEKPEKPVLERKPTEEEIRREREEREKRRDP
jgi:hypothetical protein